MKPAAGTGGDPQLSFKHSVLDGLQKSNAYKVGSPEAHMQRRKSKSRSPNKSPGHMPPGSNPKQSVKTPTEKGTNAKQLAHFYGKWYLDPSQFNKSMF